MGNKKKKSSNPLVLNECAADDGLNTAVPEGAPDQLYADSAGDPRIHQKRKGKRVEADIAATVGSGGHVESVSATGFSTKKRYVKENVADDRAPTGDSAADSHTVKEAKNVLKKRKHRQSVGDRSVESDGARVLSEDDHDADAAPPQPKHKKSRNGVVPVQQYSAGGEQLDSSKVSTKKSFAKAVSQPEAPAASNSKSSKDQKSTSKENRENGSASNARAPKNARGPAKEQLAAAKVAECSGESPVADESSAAAGQSPSKKAKKNKKKKTKKSSTTEAPAESDVPKVSARDAALAYLDAWKTDKLNWSFQKVRQVWLLQHMYSAADLDDDRFTILLEYLEPMKGKAREETVRKAEEMLAKADDADTPAGDGSSAPGVDGSSAPVISELALLRAKEIVQQLSVD